VIKANHQDMMKHGKKPARHEMSAIQSDNPPSLSIAPQEGSFHNPRPPQSQGAVIAVCVGYRVRQRTTGKPGNPGLHLAR
jgi:hypothetical protein